jgi:mannose-6-phosphate isomerase-like protein (cupin superfamily)
MEEVFDSKNNLSRIHEIAKTFRLKELSSFCSDSVEYNVITGRCVGRGLLNSQDVAVQVVEQAPDTSFPEHIHHDNSEYVIMVRGSLTNTMDGKEELFVAGDCFVIPLGKAHNHYSKDGCKLIAVTIPASEGYPNVSR